jgi:predicted signal transduction protein with EAL and GGDEF domain
MEDHGHQLRGISMEVLFEPMPVAMVLPDRSGRHVVLSQALASFSGTQAKDIVGINVSSLSKESGGNMILDFRLFDGGKDLPDHDVDIGNRVYHAATKPVRNRSGYAIGEMVAPSDITKNKETERALKRANEELEYLASHDPLTGVLNSRTYRELRDRLMCVALRDGIPFPVLFVDPDHFRNIDDTYGHDAGDAVLKSVAARMSNTSRQCDVPREEGGDRVSSLSMPCYLESDNARFRPEGK